MPRLISRRLPRLRTLRMGRGVRVGSLLGSLVAPVGGCVVVSSTVVCRRWWSYPNCGMFRLWGTWPRLRRRGPVRNEYRGHAIHRLSAGCRSHPLDLRGSAAACVVRAFVIVRCGEWPAQRAGRSPSRGSHEGPIQGAVQAVRSTNLPVAPVAPVAPVVIVERPSTGSAPGQRTHGPVALPPRGLVRCPHGRSFFWVISPRR
jgi:hypothetical protein